MKMVVVKKMLKDIYLSSWTNLTHHQLPTLLPQRTNQEHEASQSKSLDLASHHHLFYRLNLPALQHQLIYQVAHLLGVLRHRLLP